MFILEVIIWKIKGAGAYQKVVTKSGEAGRRLLIVVISLIVIFVTLVWRKNNMKSAKSLRQKLLKHIELRWLSIVLFSRCCFTIVRCYEGDKKCSFFWKFGVLCFLEIPILRFALLPYYFFTPSNTFLWIHALKFTFTLLHHNVSKFYYIAFSIFLVKFKSHWSNLLE